MLMEIRFCSATPRGLRDDLSDCRTRNATTSRSPTAVAFARAKANFLRSVGFAERWSFMVQQARAKRGIGSKKRLSAVAATTVVRFTSALLIGCSRHGLRSSQTRLKVPLAAAGMQTPEALRRLSRRRYWFRDMDMLKAARLLSRIKERA